jgi:hypothetical protein
MLKEQGGPNGMPQFPRPGEQAAVNSDTSGPAAITTAQQLPFWKTKSGIVLIVLGGLVVLGAIDSPQSNRSGGSSVTSSSGWSENWAASAEGPCRRALHAKVPNIDTISWTQAISFSKKKDGPVSKVQLRGMSTFSAGITINGKQIEVPMEFICEFFPDTDKACVFGVTESENEACRSIE